MWFYSELLNYIDEGENMLKTVGDNSKSFHAKLELMLCGFELA